MGASQNIQILLTGVRCLLFLGAAATTAAAGTSTGATALLLNDGANCKEQNRRQNQKYNSICDDTLHGLHLLSNLCLCLDYTL